MCVGKWSVVWGRWVVGQAGRDGREGSDGREGKEGRDGRDGREGREGGKEGREEGTGRAFDVKAAYTKGNAVYFEVKSVLYCMSRK